jgi:hypothetical protein
LLDLVLNVFGNFVALGMVHLAAPFRISRVKYDPLSFPNGEFDTEEEAIRYPINYGEWIVASSIKAGLGVTTRTLLSPNLLVLTLAHVGLLRFGRT